MATRVARGKTQMLARIAQTYLPTPKPQLKARATESPTAKRVSSAFAGGAASQLRGQIISCARNVIRLCPGNLVRLRPKYEKEATVSRISCC